MAKECSRQQPSTPDMTGCRRVFSCTRNSSRRSDVYRRRSGAVGGLEDLTGCVMAVDHARGFGRRHNELSTAAERPSADSDGGLEHFLHRSGTRLRRPATPTSRTSSTTSMVLRPPIVNRR